MLDRPGPGLVLADVGDETLDALGLDEGEVWLGTLMHGTRSGCSFPFRFTPVRADVRLDQPIERRARNPVQLRSVNASAPISLSESAPAPTTMAMIMSCPLERRRPAS
jgi:hypothetical protein